MSQKLILVCLLFIIIFPDLIARDDQKKLQIKNREAVYKSLMNGINSDNFGLRTSSAFMLGELKFTESVVPLMSMLHNEDDDGARIVAALSLYKIGDARGIYAVKKAIRFDESPRVNRMCEILYQSYRSDRMKEKTEG